MPEVGKFLLGILLDYYNCTSPGTSKNAVIVKKKTLYEANKVYSSIHSYGILQISILLISTHAAMVTKVS